jgi:hypothetical protein
MFTTLSPYATVLHETSASVGDNLWVLSFSPVS